MALEIDAVYQGLADAINDAQLPGNTAKIIALPFAPDSVVAPQLILADFVGDYDKTFDGLMELTINAWLLLARVVDKAGQQEAQRLAGAGENTVRAAIQAARGAPGQMALNGAADDVVVRRVVGPRPFDWGESHYYGLQFTIFVMG